MSKVKIKGNASGTGVLTIEAPNTNDDSTITLPDGTGELIQADASGNVGIGVTPESTSIHSSYTSIDISRGGALAGHSAGNGMKILGNSYRTASGYAYKNTDKASLYANDDGLHEFKVAASGTADSAISWTTALQITNDGRGVSQFTAAFWARVRMDDDHSVTGSHNVSSVTDRGVGLGTLNFTTNLSDANYCVTGSAFGGGGENDQREFQHSNEVAWSTSAWGWCCMDELETANDVRSANMVGFGG
jgi:hypothetical protein